jgi:hypothetical protein
MLQVRTTDPKPRGHLGRNNTAGEEKIIKNISDLKPDYTNAMDVRGEPTHVCPCGSQLWNIKAMFQDYEISMYFLDMECAECGTKATAPTLPDMPEDYVMMDDRPKEEYTEED